MNKIYKLSILSAMTGIRSIMHAARAPALLTSCMLCVPGLTAAPSEPPPVQPDAAGKRAWELLGAHYREDRSGANGEMETTLDAAFRDLDGDDVAKSKEASVLLLALFRQAAADESNGRAVWRRTPYWGVGPESNARNFRAALSVRFGKSGNCEAAVPVAVWLLSEERLPDAQRAAVAVLERCTNPSGDKAIAELLDKGNHSRPAIVMALEQGGKRGLKSLGGTIGKWALDPRQSIRKAAAEALTAIGAGTPGEFKPEDGFNDPTQKLLRDLLALLPDPPDAKTAFGKFEVSGVYDNGEEYKHSMTGWLRSQKDGVMQVTAWDGASSELKSDAAKKRTFEFKPADVGATVASIRELRESKDKDARDKLMRMLSARGGFTGQFEPRMLSAPEGLLAAWLYLKGDKPNAAALLFPLLDELDDDRWAFEIVRELVAKHCHLAMLESFSDRRDYPETIRLAKHLSQPLFDGYKYQPRAKELVVQLAKRAEDFKTFVLPPDEEWKKTAATLPREKQVEYLASRLRLLNCFQLSQPGDVNYRDEQYLSPGAPWSDQKKGGKPDKVINPYNELRKLRLVPGDLTVLAPFLKDDNFLPTYSYWRDFHPDRTLHRVNWLVAELVNGAAMRTVIDLDGWQDLPAEERDQRVEGVLIWAGEMAGKSVSEVIKDNMDRAPGEKEWFRAAAEAARSKESSLLPEILTGAEKYTERKAAVAELCFRHGSAEAVGSARFWIKLKDAKLKLYAALILARHGAANDKSNALAALREVMAGSWDDDPLDAIGPMLSMDDADITGIACSILRRPELDWGYSDWVVAHQLFLTKHPAALAALLEVLESTADAKNAQGEWQGQKVTRNLTRGDHAAAVLARIRLKYEFPEYAPDKERAAARRDFAEWLATQAALLKAGKPTPELDTRVRRVSEPQSDVP